MSRLSAIDLAYLLAAVCFIVALKGLSTPQTARAGNLIGAAGAVVAVGATFAVPGLSRLPLMAAAIVTGGAIGVPAARAVRITAVPQMVAAFNGVGGAAAALVSMVEFSRTGNAGIGTSAAVIASAVVGFVSFTGSAVTFAKLQEMITGRPVVLPGQRVINPALWVAIGALTVAVLVTSSTPLLLVLGALALVLGVLFVLPVAGADVPVVISLLNSFTGLAVAASGAVLHNTLLIVAGTLVGASGTLLTKMMSQAMGRPLTHTLFGALTAVAPTETGAAVVDRPVRTGTVEDVAIMLAFARKVVVVPGYGLAVAQAQHVIRDLESLLEKRGVEVVYAIHPVAGRMPGHMNVLLAEANVPYEQLLELEQANTDLPHADVALVVGANDVVNPSARNDTSSPIYGMPILDVDAAANVVFLKRSMRPGFAGVENPLLYEPKTTMLFGDARESLTALVAAVRTV